jgi:hypothetical protein
MCIYPYTYIHVCVRMEYIYIYLCVSYLYIYIIYTCQLTT